MCYALYMDIASTDYIDRIKNNDPSLDKIEISSHTTIRKHDFDAISAIKDHKFVTELCINIYTFTEPNCIESLADVIKCNNNITKLIISVENLSSVPIFLFSYLMECIGKNTSICFLDNCS